MPQSIESPFWDGSSSTDKSLVTLGKGCKVGEFVLLGVKPRTAAKPLVIGDGSTIRSHSVLYLGNSIGKNFQCGHGAMIRENNTIGDNVSVGTHSIIERDSVIGNGVRIHSRCFIPEFITIEDGAWIGPGVTITNTRFPKNPLWEQTAKGTVIGQNAIIGANVTLLPNVKIGKNAFVGAGAIVSRDVPDGMVAYGTPAVLHGKRDEMKSDNAAFTHAYEWEKPDVAARYRKH